MRRRRFWRRWVLPIALLLVILAFGILGLALQGFRDGTAERLRQTQQQVEIHLNRGDVWMQCEQYQMAEAEFQEALRLMPDHAQAGEKLLIAQQKQTVTPSPTVLTPTAPVPTPTTIAPTPTTMVVVIPATQVLFDEGITHYQKREWDQAIVKLAQVRQLDSTYKSDQTTEMLFQSHYQLGLQLVEQNSFEEAIAHFDDALDLKPRDREVENQRRWADLYAGALGVWEVDWEGVIKNLVPLYIQAGDYKDTASRLYQAYITYAQVHVNRQQWCEASELYESALEIRNDDPQIEELGTKTNQLCETAPVTAQETPSPAGVWPPQGDVHLGSLVASCYDYQTNQSTICLQTAADNKLHMWLSQAEQPALTLDGTLLAYRSTDPARPGLYAVNIVNVGAVISGSNPVSGTRPLGNTGIITITTEAEAHYPTWSPDKKQIAYTAYDQSKQDWFIYIADLAGQREPRLIRKGRWPTWGPSGLLAFTTCTDPAPPDSNRTCGIYTYAPGTGELHRLTASVKDYPTSWSPSGDEIAYMSDASGISYELYVVRTNGYVRQITANISTDAMPYWSPDGQRIAYVTNHPNDWWVYTIYPYGGQVKRLAAIGAQSAEWTGFRLAWVAPVIQLVE